MKFLFASVVLCLFANAFVINRENLVRNKRQAQTSVPANQNSKPYKKRNVHLERRQELTPKEAERLARKEEYKQRLAGGESSENE